MKANKVIKGIIAILNVIGVLCLIYFTIPYVTHNTTVHNPDAMIPAEAWDIAGMTITIGLIPLGIANLLGFLFIRSNKKAARLAWFIPSAICLVLAISYWI